MTEQIDWDAIDSFVADADKDDRYGEHDAMVTSVSEKFWDDGRKSYDIETNLVTTRDNAPLRINLPEPMTKAELTAAAQSANKRGIALGQRLVSELYRFYNIKGATDLKAGDMLRVKVGPQKSKKTGQTYPRVIAFKPKEELSGKKAATTDDIPF